MAWETIGLERVDIAGTGFKGAEGIVVDREGSIYGGGSDGVVRKRTPDGRMTELACLSGRPLGMALDGQGNLFVCDGGGHGVLRITADGDVSVFADRVGDLRLVAANFAVFDSHGDLYVTNSTDYPTTDLERFMAELAAPAPRGAVVRLRPDGRGDVVATGLFFANGVAIDPSEEGLYVLESTQQGCVRIAIRKDGTHGAPEPYGPRLGGLCDGCAFDAEGDLIVTLPMANKLVVLEPSGELTTLLEDPDGTKIVGNSNCAFGGPRFDDLYVTSFQADHVARVKLGRPGHRLYHCR